MAHRGFKERPNVAKVEVGYNFGGEPNLLPQVIGDTLRITLSNGKGLSIEMFERTPGSIVVRAGSGHMVIHPEASNTIRLEPTG